MTRPHPIPEEDSYPYLLCLAPNEATGYIQAVEVRIRLVTVPTEGLPELRLRDDLLYPAIEDYVREHSESKPAC